MKLEIAAATIDHVPAIARIGFEAFYGISTAHGFAPDFTSAEEAVPVYELLVRRSDYIGVVALVDGIPVGSNFLQVSDDIGAVGPLSIDPNYQNQGIGRLLMTAIMAQAARQRIQQMRLLQDSYNVAALSLYSSLGFVVRDAVSLIRTDAAPVFDRSIRLMTKLDLPDIERMSRKHYHTSRRNEVALCETYGFHTYVREREGRIVAYYIPGLAGHGIAETEHDLVALIGDAGRSAPIVFRKFLCPMRQSALFQESLKNGWHVEKLLTYMTYGPYEYPTAVCIPSACY